MGRRHPDHGKNPEAYSPIALRQISHLALLHRPAFFVDASTTPPEVARRVLTILDSKVFRVDQATMEGLDHLLTPNPLKSVDECELLAKRIGLKSYTLDSDGIAKLSRLANVLEANPKLVNPELNV